MLSPFRDAVGSWPMVVGQSRDLKLLYLLFSPSRCPAYPCILIFSLLPTAGPVVIMNVVGVDHFFSMYLTVVLIFLFGGTGDKDNSPTHFATGVKPSQLRKAVVVETVDGLPNIPQYPNLDPLEGCLSQGQN